jgi:phospho-N-acetylmuramoyl-pentapeptide-transferase
MLDRFYQNYTLSYVALSLFGGFILSFILTPLYTFLAYKYKWWKVSKTHSITGEKASVLHKMHASKHARNIPTAAGIIAMSAVTIFTIVIGNVNTKETLLPLAMFILGGSIGLLDDFLNIRGFGGGKTGLRSSLKMILILFVALIGALYFYFKLNYNMIHIPMVGDMSLGWMYIPFFILVIVSTANAVNITDGLDGLAGGLLTMSFSTFAVISYMNGLYSMSAFCATVAGATLAYTWFNIYPARFFMGDSGAFALGTTLGVIAMLNNSALLLPIIGGVFVFDAFSSALQILSKKIRKKKIFISAPVHHHLEAIGWPESKVTMRFWVIGAICSAVGLICQAMMQSIR